MRRKTFCYLLMLLQFVGSCGQSQSETAKVHTVVWEGISDVQKITFSVDGKRVGVGVAGLKKVFAFLQACELKATVRFQATEADWYGLNEKYGVDSPLPLEAFRLNQLGDFSEVFRKVVKARDLQIERTQR